MVLSLASMGCDGASTADAGVDSGSPDGGALSDAPLSDAPLSDAPLSDVSIVEDSPSDAAIADAGIDASVSMDGMCEYTALDEVVVRCGGNPTFVSRIGVFPASRDCPDFYVVGDRPTHYESQAQAIDGEGCDTTCMWHFMTSVTRMFCGHRAGYEVLRAEGAGCPDLYRFDDGYYESVEAYDSTHPCP